MCERLFVVCYNACCLCCCVHCCYYHGSRVIKIVVDLLAARYMHPAVFELKNKFKASSIYNYIILFSKFSECIYFTN